MNKNLQDKKAKRLNQKRNFPKVRLNNMDENPKAIKRKSDLCPFLLNFFYSALY